MNAPLMLPAPSWHTANPYGAQFSRWLDGHSDDELIERLNLQRQFFESFAGGGRSYTEFCNAGATLPHEKWQETMQSYQEVKDSIQLEMVIRFQRIVWRREKLSPRRAQA